MSRMQSVVRSIASNWAALVVNVLLSFFLSPFVVNKLGSVYYGIWALTLQFTGYLYLLDFGVRESVVRYTSKYNARGQGQKLNAVLTAAISIYLPITLICVALTVVCAFGVPQWFNLDPAVHSDAFWATLLVGLTIAQAFVFNVFTGIQYGLQRFDLANMFGIGVSIVRAALIVVFLNQGFGIVALAAIQFGVALVGGLISVAIALRLLRSASMPFGLVRLRGRHRRALTARVFGYGWYVLVNNIGQKIIFASSAIVIGVFQPIASVTYYAIAGSLIDHLRNLMVSTAHVFNPLSSDLHAQGRGKEVGGVLLTGAKMAVLIALPIALSFAILGEEFIALWMGVEFAEPAGEVLLVLALTQIVSAPHHVVSSVLYGISQHRLMALIRIGEGCVNLAVSIWLVHSLGIVGVALGTAISHIFVVAVVLPLRMCRVVGLGLGEYYVATYGRPFVAALPFAGAAMLVTQLFGPAPNLFIFFAKVAALVALYVPGVYLLALSRSEQAMIRRLLPGRRGAVVSSSAGV